jgi:methionyl-tRNA formyltransferase
MPLRLAFMGSSAFAVPALRALVEAGHHVVCVYSQPPRPAGRGKAERPTPVHAVANELSLSVRTPQNFRDPDERQAFADLELEAAVVASYGLILPRSVLDAPLRGCFNIHGSLLPRWRGAAPIQRAIMAGDPETGVEVMKMEPGLDTGPVMLSARTPILEADTFQDVHDRLAMLGADLIVRALMKVEAGSAVFRVQSEEGVTYASKISPEEARIDWTGPAERLSAHIRGLSPHPGSWFEWPTDKGPVRVKALNVRVEEGHGEPGTLLDDGLLVACGRGALRFLRLQREGRSPMDAADVMRGFRTAVGTRFL